MSPPLAIFHVCASFRSYRQNLIRTRKPKRKNATQAMRMFNAEYRPSRQANSNFFFCAGRRIAATWSTTNDRPQT